MRNYIKTYKDEEEPTLALGPDLTLSTASFIGTCPKCGEPSTGCYDCEDDPPDFMMTCVSCLNQTHHVLCFEE